MKAFLRWSNIRHQGSSNVRCECLDVTSGVNISHLTWNYAYTYPAIECRNFQLNINNYFVFNIRGFSLDNQNQSLLILSVECLTHAVLILYIIISLRCWFYCGFPMKYCHCEQRMALMRNPVLPGLLASHENECAPSVQAPRVHINMEIRLEIFQVTSSMSELSFHIFPLSGMRECTFGIIC